MSRKTKQRTTGGGGSILALLWAGYSHFTTAKDLAPDANVVAKVLADPPSYLPWLIAAGFVLLFTWSFWPSDEEPEREGNATKTNGDKSPIQQTGDNGTNVARDQHNQLIEGDYISAPPKFSSKQEVNTLPPAMGGNQFLDLGGVSSLRISPPYSDIMVTMGLDEVPLKMHVPSTPGVQVFDSTFTILGGKTFVFDTGDNKRHTIEVAGAIFTVTLIEIDPRPVPKVAKAIRYTFSVKER